MDNDTLRITSRLFEHLDHGFDVMPVNRTEISDPHILEEHSGNNELFETALVFLQFVNYSNTARKFVKCILKSHLEVPVCIRGTDVLKVT